MIDISEPVLKIIDINLLVLGLGVCYIKYISQTVLKIIDINISQSALKYETIASLSGR